MKFLLPFVLSSLPFAAVAQSPSPSTQPPADPPTPRTTEVMVILTAREGVSRQQIMTIMPAEIRATVVAAAREEHMLERLSWLVEELF